MNAPLPSFAERLPRYTRFILPATLLLALALRVFRLDLQPLWWDEGYSVFFATRDLASMVARTAVDIHPPLYYALLHFWVLLFGKADVSLRALSVVIGLGTVPVIYLLGDRLLGRRVALLASLLLAVSPLHIYYSQEVRMYGLVTLLGLVSVVLQIELLGLGRPGAIWQSKPGSRRRRVLWTLYVLAVSAALYTEYYAVFLLAAEVVLVLGVAGRLRDWHLLRGWFLAWVAIGLLFLPWAAYAASKLLTYVTSKVGIEQFSPLDPVAFIGQQLVAFSVGHLTQYTWLGWAAVLFLALLLYSASRLLHHWRSGPAERACAQPDQDRRNPPEIVLLIYLFVPLVLAWLLNLIYPFHPIRYERLLLLSSPAFYLMVALGLDRLARERRVLAGTALAVVLLASGLSLVDFYTVPRYTEEDYRPLIAELAATARAGDTVLAPYPWQIGYLETYYGGPAVNIYEVPAEEWGRDPSLMAPELDKLHGQNSRAWLLAFQTKGRRLEDLLANYYAGDYVLVDRWFGNSRLQYFARAEDPPLLETPFDYAPDLQLVSFGSRSGQAAAGEDFLPVRLHFMSKSNQYRFSLRLLDSNNRPVDEIDGQIPGGNEIVRVGIPLSRTLPPGEFAAQLGIYRSGSSQPLTFSDGMNELVLSRVTVSRPQ